MVVTFELVSFVFCVNVLKNSLACIFFKPTEFTEELSNFNFSPVTLKFFMCIATSWTYRAWMVVSCINMIGHIRQGITCRLTMKTFICFSPWIDFLMLFFRKFCFRFGYFSFFLHKFSFFQDFFSQSFLKFSFSCGLVSLVLLYLSFIPDLFSLFLFNLNLSLGLFSLLCSLYCYVTCLLGIRLMILREVWSFLSSGRGPFLSIKYIWCCEKRIKMKYLLQ